MDDYKNCKVIGFDLDKTLYVGSDSMDAIIQNYIFKKISKCLKVSMSDSEKLFSDLYKGGRGLSGSKTLVKLGIPNASEVVQEALENANIASVLTSDSKVLKLIQNLKIKYSNLDILTGSGDNQLKEKLKSLGIKKDLFNNFITDEISSKSSGDAYKLWMSYYPNYKPYDFLYIGDRSDLDHRIPSNLGIRTILVNVENKDNNINCPQLETLVALSKYLL